MITSTHELSEDRLGEIAFSLTRRTISEPRRLGGGRNSRVWRAQSESGEALVIKQYLETSDGGDRLATEWRALTFLTGHRIHEVPRPLGVSPRQRVALYSYIEGQAPAPNTGQVEDIRPLVEFFAAIYPLRREPSARTLPQAADAALDPSALISIIDRRLTQLNALDQATEAGRILAPFLHKHLNGAWRRRRRRAEQHRGGLMPLAPDQAVLSPSDFGFHNAVSRPDRRLGFVDFEYFGWDDPAKLIIDTVLHPHERMTLGVDQKKFFHSALMDICRPDPGLESRLHLLAPVLGLKWCLILLNEFVPAACQRRVFAGRPIDAAALTRQLTKARRMLALSESWDQALGTCS